MRDISDSINDIEKIAHEILKDSKAYDIFPTPVQKIINYANLKLDTSDLLIRPDRSFLEKFGAKLYGTVTSAIDKIIGMIDLKEDVIYLDHSMNDGRKNFVQLHEVGHGVLPWQKYTFLLDDKHTINQDTKLEFEREASIYASASLFQLGRFDEEIKKYSLNIKTAMKLANQFGSSVHASLRRYVENNPKRCSLLVLEKSKDSKNIFPDIRNYFQSLSFTKEI
jgi:Zn-dependent peptidase ImmA (M78 family)